MGQGERLEELRLRQEEQRAAREQRLKEQRLARERRIEEQRAGRRPRDARRTQEALLDAAEVIFGEVGFEGARMEKIAERADYNIALLFRYFTNKEELYRLVVARGQQEGNEELRRLLEPLLEDEAAELDQERVRRFLEAWIDWIVQLFAERPYLLRLFTWEMSNGWKVLRKVSAPPTELEWNSKALAFLQRAQAAGLLRASVDLRMLFANMFSLALFLTFFRAQLLAEGMDRASVPAGLETLLDLEVLRQHIKDQIFYGVLPMKQELPDEPSRTSD